MLDTWQAKMVGGRAPARATARSAKVLKAPVNIGLETTYDSIPFVYPRKRRTTTAVTTTKNFSKTFCPLRSFEFFLEIDCAVAIQSVPNRRNQSYPRDFSVI